MPEAPDIQVYKEYLDATSLHHKVTHMETRDTRILDETSRQKLTAALSRGSLDQVTRHGKHLFLRTDRAQWLHIHFGMTGYVLYYKRERGEPDHARVILTFANGFHLALVSQRLLGTVGLVEDPQTFVAEEGLGPDVLSVAKEEFVDILGGRRGYLKSTLMNQSLIAGVGNVYSDEILFHARLLPDHRTASLDADALGGLWNTTQDVLHKAIDARADVENMPDDWLLPHRSKGEHCPVCGGTVSTKKISGRRSYFCTHCQH